MKCEIYEGTLFIMADKAEDILALNDISVNDIVISRGLGIGAGEPEEEDKPEATEVESVEPKKEEILPEDAKDPDRDALLKRCEDLGIEVKTGTRTTTLPKLIKEALTATPKEEPKAEAKEEPKGPTRDEMLTKCKTFLHVYGEEKFKEVLNDFGLPKFSDIEDYDIPEFDKALAKKQKEIEDSEDLV